MKASVKKNNPNPQLDMFTATSMQLVIRTSKKASDPNAWHNHFFSLITTKIDEKICYFSLRITTQVKQN